MNHLLTETHAGSRTGTTECADTNPAIRKTLSLLGFALAGALLAGCGSSSSSGPGGGAGFHDDPKFANDQPNDFATSMEDMEDGDEVRVPMYQEGYSREGSEDATGLSGERANFRLSMNNGGRSIEIETPGDTFTWDDPDGIVVAGGAFDASDISGDEAMTVADLHSNYFDYVHYGFWEVNEFDEEANHVRTDGGVFRQGFETHPDDVPTTGGASYTGGMIGKVFNSGEESFEIDGTFELTANFEDNSIAGMIDSLGTFNNVSLEDGNIAGNDFAGTAVAGSGDGIQGSFTAGSEGSFEGGFFGPLAEEVGGTWHLQDGDNLAVGAFGGDQ